MYQSYNADILQLLEYILQNSIIISVSSEKGTNLRCPRATAGKTSRVFSPTLWWLSRLKRLAAYSSVMCAPHGGGMLYAEVFKPRVYLIHAK